jgi:hypothetical protein
MRILIILSFQQSLATSTLHIYIYSIYIYINASFPATLRLNIQGVREFFLVPRDGFVAEHGAGSWGEQSHGLALAYPAINGDT